MNKFFSPAAGARGRGFTLIEVMVAVLLFSIIGISLMALISSLLAGSSQQSRLLSGQDQARKLAAQITNELRNSQAGNDGSYQIESAGDQQLTFYSGLSFSNASDRIRYYLQNGKLYRGMTKYYNGPYNTSTEQSLPVQDDVVNSSSTPVFLYYDGNYSGSSTQVSLPQPVNVTQVKFVKLNLQIANRAGVLKNNFYTINSGAAIRSLKTNLGQ